MTRTNARVLRIKQVAEVYRIFLGHIGSCRVWLGLAGGFWVLQGLSGSCRVLLGLAGSCRVLLGVLGLAGSSGLFVLWVPGRAPGGGPISSCVVQTAVSDYSHTVRAPQSRAFLQAVSRPCPKTIKCRGLQMSTVVDWGDGCLLMTAMFWGNLLPLLVS